MSSNFSVISSIQFY